MDMPSQVVAEVEAWIRREKDRIAMYESRLVEFQRHIETSQQRIHVLQFMLDRADLLNMPDDPATLEGQPF
jgi:hypothetical protein